MHILYFAAAAIFLALTIYFLVQHINEARGKTTWPQAPGKVTSSGITLQRTGGENGGEFDRFEVYYKFEAAGAAHTGMLYSDSKKNFAPLAAKYPTGAEMPVFYSPEKPSHNELRDALGKTGGFPYWVLSLISAIGVVGFTLFALRF